MATKTREQLKNYFKTGDVPSQSNFGDLIDSLATTGELSSNINRLEGFIENQHPQKVIDEETFEALKDAGELDPDTIYYVTEED